MKKLLLSLVSAFLIFTLSAQVADNFSDYNVGGKLALQAHAMGRDYWDTWDGIPGSSDDGVIAEQPAGNKALFLNYGNDQLLHLGKKTSGTWDLAFKIFVPAGKNAYFNVQANFTGGQDGDWACEIYFACTNTSDAPQGTGSIRVGATTAASFTFQHDAWVDVKINMNLDDDDATLFVGGTLVHNWIYSIGASGTQPGDCPRVIDAFNIYPSRNSATSSFYIDDVVFAQAATVIFETSFDDLPNGSYVAQSYPEFWETWSNAPGTNEDALITTEQSATPPHSAKCTYGTDLVFKAGDKTSGIYTIDFDMYIPGTVPAYFNLLHIFDRGNDGQDSEWTIGVYFNIPAGNPYGLPAGTYITQNDINTTFTPLSNTWFHVAFLVDLDSDVATISIGGNLLLTWQFSLNENGGVGTRQLAALDFYPILPASVFFFDNFKYASLSGDAEPIVDVTPTEITQALPIGGTISNTVTVSNTGTSIADYASWVVYDIDPLPGTNTYDIAYCGAHGDNDIGYDFGGGNMEFGAKFTSEKICGKLGSKITTLSYYLPQSANLPSTQNEITFKIYGSLKQNEPGELLAEVVKTNPTANAWNDVTLPTSLLIDRTELWITVSLYHSMGAFPIATDGSGGQGAPTVPGANWARFGSSGSFTEFNNWGNICIKATSQGGVYPVCWLDITGDTYGTVPKNSSKTFNAVFNAAGLEKDTYKATLFVATSDANNPLFEIPCTLIVGDMPSFTVTPLLIEETITENDDPVKTVPVTITNNGSAEGEYEAVAVCADGWLTLDGETKSAVAIGESKSFNAVIDATALAVGNYEAVILISTSDPMNEMFEVACKLSKLEDIEIFTLTQTTVFPNPASGFVTVKCNKEFNAIQVINIAGQIVYSATVSGNQATIDTSKLSAGNYFIRVITNEDAHSVKLIVK